MKPGKTLKVCGSITKKESLAKFTGSVLDHTTVAEADHPYSGYYGRIPDKPKPNSLFLFTERYFTLEEALRLTQNIDICAKNKVNVASAIFLLKNHRVPAIRIRNFPDYQHVGMLQQCYINQGVRFSRKVDLENEAVVTVNKCFLLKSTDDGLYSDKNEKNEGYIKVPKRLELLKFEELFQNVRNNSNCLLFDAAMGGFIIDGFVEDIIRIYSDHLNTDLLKCIKTQILKWM
jgi:hypothetical protein